jgi:hypothetical protein
MKRALFYVIVTLLLFVASPLLAQDEAADFPVLKGPYFGQKTPEDRPLLFAPDIISLQGIMVHDTPLFSPDGQEIFWGRFSTNPNHATILYSKRINDVWTAPQAVPFSSLDSYGDGCTSMTQDGKVLYFNSFRALTEGGRSGRERIWVVDRQGGQWGEPRPVGRDVNSLDLHWQISVASNRTLFFGTDQGIMLSRFINGQHQKPEKVEDVMHPKYIGGTPYIAPDESYIIFSADELPDGLGNRDLYIGYRRKDGTWTDPVNLGNIINTPQHDLCPIITYDGKYLLYLTWRNERPGVYWYPARFIEDLRPKEFK